MPLALAFFFNSKFFCFLLFPYLYEFPKLLLSESFLLYCAVLKRVLVSKKKTKEQKNKKKEKSSSEI